MYNFGVYIYLILVPFCASQKPYGFIYLVRLGWGGVGKPISKSYYLHVFLKNNAQLKSCEGRCPFAINFMCFLVQN